MYKALTSNPLNQPKILISNFKNINIFLLLSLFPYLQSCNIKAIKAILKFLIFKSLKYQYFFECSPFFLILNYLVYSFFIHKYIYYIYMAYSMLQSLKLESQKIKPRFNIKPQIEKSTPGFELIINVLLCLTQVCTFKP